MMRLHLFWQIRSDDVFLTSEISGSLQWREINPLWRATQLGFASIVREALHENSSFVFRVLAPEEHDVYSAHLPSYPAP